MRHAHARLELSNPRRPELATMQVEALADTDAIMLCLPSHVARQLALETQEEREVLLADGSAATVPYVGPIEVRFANRRGFVGALVLGDTVLLGAVPMEDMDLVVSPRDRQVTVNPASPNFASSRA